MTEAPALPFEARLERLTARQREIYDFLREFARIHGFSPTLREIGQNFGFSGFTGTKCHLAALEKKGLIRRSPGTHRGLMLLDPPGPSSPDRPGDLSRPV